jgi:hypothetical protein
MFLARTATEDPIELTYDFIRSALDKNAFHTSNKIFVDHLLIKYPDLNDSSIIESMIDYDLLFNRYYNIICNNNDFIILD